MLRAGRLSTDTRLMICVVESPPGTIAYGHYMLRSSTVVEESETLSVYLGAPGYHHDLLAQVHANAYDQPVYRSTERPNEVLPSAHNLGSVPVDGYGDLTHRDAPDGFRDFGGFPRCVVYPGGPTGLTMNTSLASYVSYLSAEVCRHSVCETTW